jgi:hypothetical protein
MNPNTLLRLASAIVTTLLGLATSAHAGPPLICHPLDIGQAKSLPWIDVNHGNTDYDLKNLTRDTLVILDANTPVVVRMETLRRATLYARQDSRVAKELLTRLHARATDSDGGNLGALAWFDVGYLAETYKQWLSKSEPNPASGVDGYALVKKAISLRGSDPEMEFAAALITLAGPERDRMDHLEKAMAGAKNDPLLARNLALNFNHQTMAEMLADRREEELRK